MIKICTSLIQLLSALSTSEISHFREQFLNTKLAELSGQSEEKDVEKDSRPEIELEKKLYEIPLHLQVGSQTYYQKSVYVLSVQIANISETEKDKMAWVTGLMEVPIPIE